MGLWCGVPEGGQGLTSESSQVFFSQKIHSENSTEDVGMEWHGYLPSFQIQSEATICEAANFPFFMDQAAEIPSPDP